MFLITIRARPAETNEYYGQAGGAYVNAYINFNDPWGAQKLAQLYLQDAGWLPEETENVEKITGEPPEEVREHVEQAQRDGYAIVYNCWPVGAEDDD